MTHRCSCGAAPCTPSSGATGRASRRRSRCSPGYTARTPDELEIVGHAHDAGTARSRTAQEAGLRFVHQDSGSSTICRSRRTSRSRGLPAGPGTGHPMGAACAPGSRSCSPTTSWTSTHATPIGTLRPSDQTMVAIARALQDQDADRRLILVLDEPTARLAAHESELLLDACVVAPNSGRRSHRQPPAARGTRRSRRLHGLSRRPRRRRARRPVAERGRSSSRSWRAGRCRRCGPRGDTPHTSRAGALGRGARGGPCTGWTSRSAAARSSGSPASSGRGDSSLLRKVFGEHAPDGGAMHLDGAPIEPRGVGEAMDAGVAMVPEDRRREAAFTDLRSPRTSPCPCCGSTGPTGHARAGATYRRRVAHHRFGVKAAGPEALFSSCRAATSRRSSWPAGCSAAPACCCSTSRPRAWT